jgi:hypothetical protein
LEAFLCFCEWVDQYSEQYYEQVAAGIDVPSVKPVMDWNQD